jgi:hypothetical protein
MGLVDFLEPLCRLGSLGHRLQIGVVLPRKLAIARLISAAVAVRGTSSVSS